MEVGAVLVPAVACFVVESLFDGMKEADTREGLRDTNKPREWIDKSVVDVVVLDR